MRSSSFPTVFTSCLLASCLLTGCSANFNSIASSQSSLGAISGATHGGRQPIFGAKIYLLEANTKVYAGPGIAADSSGTTTDNSSKSLLTSGDGSDALGFYVLTHSDGSFSISGDYSTCDTGAQVYLYSLGGKPDGANENSSAGLMAVLGACGSFGNGTTVNMNELSTVAAAYAFAGFASDATHVGAPSSTDALAATGITNAFANAQQIFDISTNPYSSAHSAPSATKYGTGTVPRQHVNTLANILSACINSTVGGSPCGTLFADVANNGAAPADTASAAIDMAQHPAVQVSAIYGITGSGPNPYTPWDNAAAPNDFTIAVFFSYTSTHGFYGLAVDASGNIWVTLYGSPGGAVAFSSLGVPFPNTPYTGGNMVFPSTGAIDSLGNFWIANSTGSSMTKIDVSTNPYTVSSVGSLGGDAIAVGNSDTVWLTSADTLVEYANNGTLLHSTSNAGADGLAIDSSGRVWVVVPSSAGSYVNIFSSTDSLITSFPPGNGIYNPADLAIDHFGNAWISNGDSSLSKYASDGSVSPNSPITLGGYQHNVAMDGSGHAWISCSTGVVELDTDGTFLSTTQGYSPNYNNGILVAVDGSGNVWASDQGANPAYISEFFGAATPVVTPIAAGVQNNTLASRP